MNDSALPMNILLIVCDQMTVDLMGTYGHPVVRTPHLDALAARGVRFDAAYSPCPICAPARQCMMTGKYTSTNRCYDNGAPLVCDEPAIGHYLTNAGYDTVLSGKMHFVGPDQLHGFRLRTTYNIYPADFRWTCKRGHPELTFTQLQPHPDTWGVHAQAYVGEAIRVDRIAQTISFDEETHFRALEYLRARSEQNQRDAGNGKNATPFFLCTSYHHPHEPFLPPREWWDLYEDAEIAMPEIPDGLGETMSVMDRWLHDFHGTTPEWRERYKDPESTQRVRRAYYALVSYIDNKVGELMAALERFGFADNTVVLFTSDHGDMLCERGMVQKRVFYEYSARVPMLLALPNGRGAGRVSKRAVSLNDVLPTCLDVAGVAEPERLSMDGRSMLPLMEGEGEEERVVFSEMHGEGVQAPCFMVRRGQYKYNYFDGHGEQLFDLENDPREWNDLARDPANRALADELRGLILGRFDPEAIEADVRDSIARRFLIQKALAANGTHWGTWDNLKQQDCYWQYL